MGHSNCDTCGHDKKMCSCEKIKFVAQEGGDHYQAEYQHWDWVIDIHMSYLPACATKYVSRWWKKNGVQDLLKAKTYVQKMIANYDKIILNECDPPANIDQLNSRFRKANHLPDMEFEICCLLSDWQSKNQLEFVVKMIDQLTVNAQKALDAIALAMATQGRAGHTSPPAGQKTGGAGRGSGAMVQAAPSSASIEPLNNAIDGMEHPFGYDAWSEGPIQK